MKVVDDCELKSCVGGLKAFSNNATGNATAGKAIACRKHDGGMDRIGEDIRDKEDDDVVVPPPAAK